MTIAPKNADVIVVGGVRWSVTSDTDATDVAEVHTGTCLSLRARLDSAVHDQRREIIAFCEEAIGNLDTRIARIARNHDGEHTELPAWQHLVRRRECLRRLKQEV